MLDSVWCEHSHGLSFLEMGRPIRVSPVFDALPVSGPRGQTEWFPSSQLQHGRETSRCRCLKAYDFRGEVS
jgi:hypothetical protein